MFSNLKLANLVRTVWACLEMHFIRASEKPTEPARSIFLNTGTCRIRSLSTAFNISGRTAVLLQEMGDSVLNSVISKTFWTMKFHSDVAFFSLSLAKLVGPSFRKLDFTQRKATFEKNFFLWGWRGSVKLFMLYDFGRVLIIGNICTIGYGWISNSHQSFLNYDTHNGWTVKVATSRNPQGWNFRLFTFLQSLLLQLI